MTHHLPSILRRVKDAGHRVFTSDDYNLNIVGVRTASRTSNAFDDNLFCVYRVKGEWQMWHWYITSDPGTFYLENPMNVRGTAILCAGQYRGAWRFGLHRNRYEALVQHKAVRVWRDADRNSVLDLDVPFPFRVAHEGKFGINFHRASAKGSTTVGKFSAGCQVFAHPEDYIQFLGICKKQIEHHPTWMTFTYTLLED